MAEVKKARLFLRRGSDTDRRDTVLCQGELGYSTDAFRIFIGDGSTEGGKSVGSFMYVSGGALGANFHTNLTTASANGRAHKGDIAIFPAQSYTNAAGGTVTPGVSASTVMILTAATTADGSEQATPTSWVAVNSGIPFGNIDVGDDDISGDKVHGGTISGPVTLSGGQVNIGGDGTSENLVLSGVALSAATVPTGDLIYPLGLTSTSELTCVNSILDFGPAVTGGSGLGTTTGYIAAATTNTAASAVSAYADASSNLTFSSTAYGNTSGANAGVVYGSSGSPISTFFDYMKSGGAYADGSVDPLVPGSWAPWSITTYGGRSSAIYEVVYDEGSMRNAMNAATLNFENIREFYFSVYYTRHDDSAQFIGVHNHQTKTNEIVDWEGSSIDSGRMREVIVIPNTYGTSLDAYQKCLVLHLGIARIGKIGIILTGVRVNVS